ncbi:MAG: HEAT repeat domain-containing protein, partial [Planctomycetota bacterium]|nr:HEAT repeat domain-containing protein [Planctomycetota bacterium]
MSMKIYARLLTATLLIALPPALLCEPAKPGDPKPTPDAREDSEKPVWIKSLDSGLTQAQAKRQPVLVVAGADWCTWCRRLETELEKHEARVLLANWTLVHLDVDRSRREAMRLNIQPIPALRILNSLGRLVAAKDGYMKLEDLSNWLDEHYEQAAAQPPKELTSGKSPTMIQVIRLTRQFSTRDAQLREAILRRLAPYPRESAASIVDVFADGKLAEKLVALELLNLWKAPVDGIDPWRPETITAKRLDTLRAWATKQSGEEENQSNDVAPEELQKLEEQVGRLLQAPAEEVSTLCGRLAIHGDKLMPVVAARLKEAHRDQDRERLTALRYWLVAPLDLTLKWPNGLRRLASLDQAVRRAAADELSKRATGKTAPLLLELFSDSDPFVREMSLRTLDAVGGSVSAAMLSELLKDPEPNVRVAVLKQMAENPSPTMLDSIEHFLKSEKDTALVAQALRVLREAKDPATLNTLMALLKHE